MLQYMNITQHQDKDGFQVNRTQQIHLYMYYALNKRFFHAKYIQP